MKKFFVCLCLTALFAGFVFYLGWVQIKVKPENVGVIISKTHGLNNKPVIPGEFNWTYQFLIPTNAELKQFKITPVNCQKTITGQLPSGELYTSIFNSDNNFEYRFTYSISVTVAPEAIIQLLQENKISNQEDFEEYLNGTADTVAQLATNYILEKVRNNPTFRPESIRRDDLFRDIKVFKDYPELELSVFAITESVVPDFNLYSKIKEQFINKQDNLIQNNLEDLNNDTEYTGEE